MFDTVKQYNWRNHVSFPRCYSQLGNVMCHQSCVCHQSIRKYLYLTLNNIRRNYCKVVYSRYHLFTIFVCDSYFQHSQLTYTQDCYQLNNLKDLIVYYCICQTSSLHREHAHWLPPGPSYH